MNWSGVRKLFYATLLIVIVFGSVVFVLKDTLFPKPTCSDGKQNGYESGVDCGGLCAKRCMNEVIPVSVSWSRVLPVSNNMYDLVAFVSNKNSDSAPMSLSANFTVFDGEGKIIFQKTIVTTPPAATDIPILLQNVRFNVTPKTIAVNLNEGTSYKISPVFQTTQISTVQTRFENGDTPRVYATVKNVTRTPFSRIPIRVVLYDNTQTAIAVGESFIESLDKEEIQTVVFTWKRRFSETPAIIRIYPVLDPFSR